MHASRIDAAMFWAPGGCRPKGPWLSALGYCCTISIVGLSSGLADLLAWTLSEPGWAGLEDGLGWVVVVWGCCGDGGGLVWMVGAPLGRPVALTPGSSPGQAQPSPAERERGRVVA